MSSPATAEHRTVVEERDPQRYRLESGYRTDSYVFAIERCGIPLQPPDKSRVFFGGEDRADGDSRLLIIPGPPALSGALLAERDLEYYRRSAFWRRLRWALLAACWCLWLLLLLLVAMLVALHPKCVPTSSSNKWWHSAVVYELWVPSFQDAASPLSDGWGDLTGVKERLNDLVKIGVSAIYLRPFLSMEDSGMGVENFLELELTIGRLKTATELVDYAHARDIRIIVDFPLVVTSLSHKWFRRSMAADEEPANAPYRDFYTWIDADEDVGNSPLGAYFSEYREPGGKHSSTGRRYFHVKDRPDLPVLNWRSSTSTSVAAALRRAIGYWIDRGVDGFQLGPVEYLARFPAAENQTDWNGVVAALKSIRSYVDEHARESREDAKNRDIFLFTTPTSPLSEELKRRLVDEGRLDGVVNTELMGISRDNPMICYRSERTVAGCANEILSDLLRFHLNNDGGGMRSSPKPWPLWALGCAFTSRVATRVGERAHAELLTMIQLLLPGTNFIYYGDEIGMRDLEGVAGNKTFPQRGAMQWDSSRNAAFTKSNQSTVQLNPDYERVNFQRQYFTSDNTQLGAFKRLTRMRRTHRGLLVDGATYITKVMDGGFAVARYQTLSTGDDGGGGTFGDVLVGVVNFSHRPVRQSLADLPPFHSDTLGGGVAQRSAIVEAVSSGCRTYSVGERLDLSSREVRLSGNEGVVISFFRPRYGW